MFLGGRLNSILRSFRHRNFRLFFGGQFISMSGTWMQTLAQSWLIYRLTHSAFLLGLTSFMGQFPAFFIAPFGGAIADRHNRHHIVVATQTAAMILAFVLAALTFAGWVQIWHVMALAFLLGVVNAFDIPARQAFFVEMVGHEDLMNAIALNAAMFNGTRIVGPAIGGALVALFGEGWCFLLNGVSYIAVIAGLLMMHLPPRLATRHINSPFEHMIEGFSYVKNAKPILALLALVGVMNLVGMPFTSLMPIFADQILGAGSRGMGILMGMSGVGAVIGSLMVASRQKLTGLGNWAAISCFFFGLTLIAFSNSKALALAGIMLVPNGVAMMVHMGACNTLIQSMVDDRLRGRVMAFYTMTFMGMAPIGSLLEGALAKPLGAPIAVSIGGFICMVGAVVFWRAWPPIREQARAMIEAKAHT